MKFLNTFNQYINEKYLMDIYNDSTRYDNSFNHIYKIIDFDKSNNTLIFKANNKYIISIKVLNDVVKTYNDIFKSDVQVHCSCNDFRYVFAYWAYKKDFGLVKEIRPSDIRNPHGNGSVCKHITGLIGDLDYYEYDINKELKKYDTKNITGNLYKDIYKTNKGEDDEFEKIYRNITKSKKHNIKDIEDEFDFSDYE